MFHLHACFTLHDACVEILSARPASPAHFPPNIQDFCNHKDRELTSLDVVMKFYHIKLSLGVKVESYHIKSSLGVKMESHHTRSHVLPMEDCTVTISCRLSSIPPSPIKPETPPFFHVLSSESLSPTLPRCLLLYTPSLSSYIEFLAVLFTFSVPKTSPYPG